MLISTLNLLFKRGKAWVSKLFLTIFHLEKPILPISTLEEESLYAAPLIFAVLQETKISKPINAMLYLIEFCFA